ncbi:MAG: GNAT family N-acetyltransferase, partial [Oscillospiraceae bacterium]|nr:GNAT family N-acetyltransferase [Oscillospiraceae bacterium]
MNIREFTIADYEAAHSLWWNTKGVCNCEKCMKLDSRGNLEKYMARNPNTCFIAEADGKLVGTVLAGHDGRTGIIYRL